MREYVEGEMYGKQQAFSQLLYMYQESDVEIRRGGPPPMLNTSSGIPQRAANDSAQLFRTLARYGKRALGALRQGL
jgi:hypothetical protein